VSSGLAAPPEIVTKARLERGLVTLAYIVTRHGPQYAPLFDRVERELIAINSGQRVLDAYTVDGGLKAIR
jgi:hypothetical protein